MRIKFFRGLALLGTVCSGRLRKPGCGHEPGLKKLPVRSRKTGAFDGDFNP